MIALAPAPKDPLQNAFYRRRLIQTAKGDEEFQRECWIRCKRDPIWWFDAFCWTFNPKDHDTSPERPFILYEFQERAIGQLCDSIGKEDTLIEKSRDMGASWINLAVFLWRWQFFPLQTFLLVSRTEDYVDKTNEPDSLFWKIDFLLARQPAWLTPAFTRNKLSLTNDSNSSTITGASTTSETGRGGRKTAILLDEFAAVENSYAMLKATRDATNSRVFNSTPQGTGNAFSDLAEKLPAERKIRLHWSVHPEKSKGLYSSTDGVLEILDESYVFPDDYKFILDGKLRSPWYDKQCQRAASSKEIAQELDIDYLNSAWIWFDADVRKELIERFCEPAYQSGMVYEESGGEPVFEASKNGLLSLWMYLNDGQPPSFNQYIVACDIATGKGGEMSSNSTATVLDRQTGEKVAALATRTMSPEDFAAAVVPLCKFFNNAFLIWEDNGPGGQFGKAVQALGYWNIFFRGEEEATDKRKTKKPGWSSSKKTKRLLLGNYGRALREHKFINRCEAAMVELGQYEHSPNGDIVHSRSLMKDDPAASGENHGDRVIADALAWRAMEELPTVTLAGETEHLFNDPPPGSMAHRLAAYDRQFEAAEDDWQ